MERSLASILQKELRIGANSTARAANLLRRGMKAVDIDLIERATIETQWAGISITLIVDELGDLQSEGIGC